MSNAQAWVEDPHYVRITGLDNEAVLEKSGIISGTGIQIHIEIDRTHDDGTVIFYADSEIPVGEKLIIKYGDNDISLYYGKIVRTAWFEKRFTDESAKLGVLYTEEKSVFRVWSPLAVSVSLLLDDSTYDMARSPKGVWECSVPGDWHRYSYKFEAEINGEIVQAGDPYAKSLTANSESSVVLDLEKTDPAGFRTYEKPFTGNLQDSVIYELHIRDATIHPESGAKHKGKFAGLQEEGTRTSGGYTTGLDYLQELGVTHVQLLPVNDFATVDELDPDAAYNWGYDPLYYQAPEGSYATDPEVPELRVRELKKMISTFNVKGLSVILDVVYNHVFIREESSFEKLVPGYYFRYHPDGTVSDGTGVGNDLASERLMVRKFIVDTVTFWLEEYRVDGFRFDLMGAMDIETMKKIGELCRSSGRPVMLLGEGWELPTALAPHLKATSAQSHQLPDVRFFNDFFRDSIKGNLFNLHDKGFINGEGRYSERLPHLVKGSSESTGPHASPFVSHVTQTVNYVECHDNHTLWDRLSTGSSEEETETLKAMQKMAAGLTILSQGVPFIHAGQEWFRSKHGDGNSYKSGDHINQLDWGKREKEEEHIAFIRDLLEIRRNYHVFRLTASEDINRKIHILPCSGPLFGYMLFDHQEDLAVYANPSRTNAEIVLPGPGRWEVLASSTGKYNSTGCVIKGQFAAAAPHEFIVLKKTRL